MELNKLIKEKSGKINKTEALIDLPMCHTSTVGNIAKFIESGDTLNIQDCPNFQEKLLYFFYGKSKYIPTKEISGFIPFDENPITLIVQTEDVISKAYRMFPFDSGGFYKERYKDYLKPEDMKNCMIMNPTDSMIRAYISIMYGDNESYINSRVRRTAAKENPLYPVVRRIVNMHVATVEENMSTEDFDGRAFTIEIQLDKNISLHKVKTYVLPLSFLSDEEGTQQLLSQLGIKKNKIIEYNDYGCGGVEKYFQMNNCIKKKLSIKKKS